MQTTGFAIAWFPNAVMAFADGRVAGKCVREDLAPDLIDAMVDRAERHGHRVAVVLISGFVARHRCGYETTPERWRGLTPPRQAAGRWERRCPGCGTTDGLHGLRVEPVAGAT